MSDTMVAVVYQIRRAHVAELFALHRAERAGEQGRRDVTQALSYTCDPRRLVARGDTDIKSFHWRGVLYVRDDRDTITPDTTGLVAPEFVDITVRPGVVVPTENAVICIVSADGWRFKAALKGSGLAPFDADWNAASEAIRKGSGT